MKGNRSPIFITGRFRSGTSFLWQIFDALDGYCAWYEPLHPELLTAIRYVTPKVDHVGVKDYWSAYRKQPSFADKYSIEFATKQLYLEASDDNRSLRAYIKHLISLSGDEVPVLQFNRMDLRLSWLRQNFPDAKIIHIERNPLQLYHSQRKHIEPSKQHDAKYWDAYELMPWCTALSESLPLLINAPSDHAFYRFYMLYQLSKLMGIQQADLKLNLDFDVFESDDFINKLEHLIPLSQSEQAVIKSLKHIPLNPETDPQQVEAYVQIMSTVDLQLAASGLLENFGQRSLKAIKFNHSAFWSNFDQPASLGKAVRQDLLLLQKEVARIDDENQAMMQAIPGGNSDQSDFVMDRAAYLNHLGPEIKQADWALGLVEMNLQRNEMTRVLAANHHLKKQLEADSTQSDSSDLDQ